MHLSLLQFNDDERLGLPSGSSFDRLIKCPPSHLLSQKAVELGQVAHETSPESARGTSIHKAYELQIADGLSVSEVADYEAIMAQREEITAQWLSSSAPVKRIAEERLWLHRGLRPVLSGQIDEILIQGNRALLFDLKTGRGEVHLPVSNMQLRIYAMLARIRWPELESVTVAILSPHFSYQPHTFHAAELDAIRDEILFTLSNLDFESAPRTGEHCRYCAAALICPARRQETQALSVQAHELPTGHDAAKFLEAIGRIESLCSSIKDHYRNLLQTDPTAVPGWRLQTSTRRWIPYPQQALERLIEQFSVGEFLSICSVNVSDLERAWGKKNNVPTAQVKAAFSRIMGSSLSEKRIAPSLRQIAN